MIYGSRQFVPSKVAGAGGSLKYKISKFGKWCIYQLKVPLLEQQLFGQ